MVQLLYLLFSSLCDTLTHTEQLRWCFNNERECSWLSLKLALSAAKALYSKALAAWMCQHSTSCLLFRPRAGCRHQITTTQSMLGDKRATKCASASIVPVVAWCGISQCYCWEWYSLSQPYMREKEDMMEKHRLVFVRHIVWVKLG